MTSSNKTALCLIVALMTLSSRTPVAAGSEARPDALAAMVEADWAAQEARLGRTAGSPESLREALRRARRLLDDLRSCGDTPSWPRIRPLW